MMCGDRDRAFVCVVVLREATEYAGVLCCTAAHAKDALELARQQEKTEQLKQQENIRVK